MGENRGFPPLLESIHQAGGTALPHTYTPTIHPHQLPLTQKETPYPIYTDNEGNLYDPWPNGWGHSLPQDTTNTVRLLTKKLQFHITTKGHTQCETRQRGIGLT